MSELYSDKHLWNKSLCVCTDFKPVTLFFFLIWFYSTGFPWTSALHSGSSSQHIHFFNSCSYICFKLLISAWSCSFFLLNCSSYSSRECFSLSICWRASKAVICPEMCRWSGWYTWVGPTALIWHTIRSQQSAQSALSAQSSVYGSNLASITSIQPSSLYLSKSISCSHI